MGSDRLVPEPSLRDQFRFELSLDSRAFVRDLSGWLDAISGQIPRPEMDHRLEQHMYVLLNADDVTTSDPQVMLDRARQALLLGHYPRAERLCRNCLRTRPHHEEARAVMSSALGAMHRSSEAVEGPVANRHAGDPDGAAMPGATGDHHHLLATAGQGNERAAEREHRQRRLTNEHRGLLASISCTIKDYRAGEIAQPTPDHVDRWIRQFAGDVQLPMLRELDHVLKGTYFSRARVLVFLQGLVTNNRLAGPNPRTFWREAHFLRVQQRGHSQVELLDMFDTALEAEFGFKTAACGAPGGDFVYLDDAVFSGNRVGDDLAAWIAEGAPAKAVVHVIVIALHTSGEWLVKKRLAQAIAASGKKIAIRYWREATIENRKASRNDSGVLWPAELPDDASLDAYLALPHQFPFEGRPVGGALGPFSSEDGRQLLERELTLAGVRIRGLSKNPSAILRPLGFSPFGLGFGSMILTFRNCPNNCPLALWWGDPRAAPIHPFSKWYPLVPRKTYAEEVDADGFDF